MRINDGFARSEAPSRYALEAAAHETDAHMLNIAYVGAEQWDATAADLFANAVANARGLDAVPFGTAQVYTVGAAQSVALLALHLAQGDHALAQRALASTSRHRAADGAVRLA